MSGNGKIIYSSNNEKVSLTVKEMSPEKVRTHSAQVDLSNFQDHITNPDKVRQQPFNVPGERSGIIYYFRMRRGR